MDREVPPPPEAAASSWRSLVMRSRPISVANSCTVTKSVMPGLVCTYQRFLTSVHGVRVPRRFRVQFAEI